MTKEKEVSGNPTHEKLAGVPFKSASEMKKVQNEIQMNIWKRLEEARVINELSKRPEYKFWEEQFKMGLTCSYGRDKEELVKIYANDNGGLQINIHERNGRDVSTECLLEVLVKAMSESFGSLYFRAKGMLPAFNPAGIDSDKKNENPVKRNKGSGKK